ncbi:MAG: LamG-like jellyroll fold domain-containing protein [Candidatus Kapaibacteriota bacterium]
MNLFIVFLLSCFATIQMQSQQYCNASLSLDGINDYGSISESFFPDPEQRTFTIEFYVKSLGNTDPIPGIWGQYGTSCYLAVFNMSGIRFSYLINGQTFSTDSTINTIGEWEHIAITGNEQTGKLSIFKNGVKIGERDHGTPNWDFIDNSSRIGAILDIFGMQETYYYHGLIDDFHVSDSVLYTQDFIPPTQITPNSRTRVLYNFNSVDGSVIQDVSINNNDLTLHNGAQLSEDVPYPGGSSIIIQEPVNQYPDFGEQAQFTLSANGQIQCQWYVNTGNGFQIMSDNDEYSGTETSQLTIKQASAQYNSYFYRCIVQRDQCSDTSNQVRVFVCGKILQQPVNINAISVDTGSFTLNHTDANATYQWQYSNGGTFVNLIPGSNYSGVNKGTLRVDKRGLGKGPHLYRCIVQSSVCADTSTTALLLVCGTIVNQPVDVKGKQNISCSFSVSNTDPQATFQWIVNKNQRYEILNDGNGISGSKTSRIMIDTARFSMNRWSFRCIMSSGICIDTSMAATLNICGSLIGQPSVPSLSRPGSTVTLSIVHTDLEARFQWQKYEANGWVNVKDDITISGSKAREMFISNVSTKDHDSRYRCITHSVICTDTSLPVQLNICGSITEQPNGIQVRSGAMGSVSVTHSDIYALYQWQSWNGTIFNNLIDAGTISGSNASTVRFNTLSMSDNNRKLRCIIKTGGCIDTTNDITIAVCGSLIMHPFNQSVKEGKQALFSIKHEDPTATFQWQMFSNNAFMNLLNNQQFNGVRNDTLLILQTTRIDSGSVFRCLINTNGCLDTSNSAQLFVITEPTNILDDDKLPLGIYPHPVQDILWIQGVQDYPIIIKNILGQTMMHGIITLQGLDISLLQSGIYVLQSMTMPIKTVTFIKK